MSTDPHSPPSASRSLPVRDSLAHTTGTRYAVFSSCASAQERWRVRSYANVSQAWKDEPLCSSVQEHEVILSTSLRGTGLPDQQNSIAEGDRWLIVSSTAFATHR